MAPVLGAELRLDYPIRWGLTVGVRSGVTAARNGATGETIWHDGLTSRTATWLDPGWLVSFPVASGAVRYGF